MEVLYNALISTAGGDKSISVISGSATALPKRVDILTTSAFKFNYAPVPGTLLGALYNVGIDVTELSLDPYIDLREICNVWLSKNISGNIGRIGCLEMRGFDRYTEDNVLRCIKSYFQMLDIAATSGVVMKTIAMPLLGNGNQAISSNLTLIPIINECIAFLNRNESCEEIVFVEINQDRANAFADALRNIYSLQEKKKSTEIQTQPMVFISHRSVDKNIADNLCYKFESRGVRVWYAPRNVVGDYASSIVDAIDRCTHFVVVLSKKTLESEHVLNEIDVAFNSSPKKKIKPLRIDDVELSSAFKYYLSRQHWMDAIVPPVEERLESFVNAVCDDM